MFKKKLLIAAFVLGIAALAIQFYSQSRDEKADPLIGSPLLDKNVIGEFDRLIIEDSQGRLNLFKKDNLWLTAEKGDFPVDMGRLFKLLDNITSHRMTSPVSRDSTRLGYFKLLYKGEEGEYGQDAVGVQLSLKKSDRIIYKMLLGKSRQGVSAEAQRYNAPGGVYVRVGDKPFVYLIKESLDLSSDPDKWINKTLFNVKKAEIKAIKQKTSAGEFTLEKEKEKFTIPGLKEKQKIKEHEISKLFSGLKNFSFEQLTPYSRQFAKTLSLKSDVSIVLLDSSSIDFQLFSLTEEAGLAKDTNKNRERTTYFIKIVPPSSSEFYQKRKALYDLSPKWFFQIGEWEAKKWMKNKKDFLQSE